MGLVHSLEQSCMSRGPVMDHQIAKRWFVGILVTCTSVAHALSVKHNMVAHER